MTSWTADRLRTTVRVLWAVALLGALLLAAAYFERSGTAPTMPTEVTPLFEPIGKSSATQSKGSEQRNLSHCTDGKGQDGVKNKHCRAASGQQAP